MSAERFGYQPEGVSGELPTAGNTPEQPAQSQPAKQEAPAEQPSVIDSKTQEALRFYLARQPEMADQAVAGVQAALAALDRGPLAPGSDEFNQIKAALLPAVALSPDARVAIRNALLPLVKDDQRPAVDQLFGEIREEAPSYRRQATEDWLKQHGTAWFVDVYSRMYAVRTGPLEFQRSGRVLPHEVRAAEERRADGVERVIQDVLAEFNRPVTRLPVITYLQERAAAGTIDTDRQTLLARLVADTERRGWYTQQ